MSELFYPEIANDYNGVKRILTNDMIYRNKKCWPLVKLDEFINFQTKETDKTAIKRKIETPENLLMTIHNVKYDLQVHPEVFYLQRLFNYYNHLKVLLDSKFEYFGKIAVCGGILTRLLSMKVYDDDFTFIDKILTNTDADIFFYNTNETEATEILNHCISLITKLAAEDSNTHEIRIERRINLTNVVLILGPPHRRYQCTYQFIHRVYPTLNSIIGGFDLGPCMVAYDGTGIVATPLGAWSIAKHALIVDNTRRSTSFEHRILKYSEIHSFSIIFPGLRYVNDHFVSKDYYMNEEQLNDLRNYLIQNNLTLNYEEYNNDNMHPFQLRTLISVKSPEICFTEFKLHKKSDLRYGTNNYCISRILKPLDSGPNAKLLTQDTLNKYSDYSDSKYPSYSIPIANARMLKCNNIDGIISYQTITRNINSHPYEQYSNLLTFENLESLEQIKELFTQMIETPLICIRDFDKYSNRFKYLLDQESSSSDDENNNEPEREKIWSTKSKVTTTAEFYPEFKRDGLARFSHPEFENRLDEKQKFFTDRINKNLEIATAQLKGIKWITQDPQRQWTSSINPVIMDPREFYRSYYNQFQLGLTREIEILLRLIRTRRTHPNLLASLPKDLFNIIIEKLVLIVNFNAT